MIATIAMPADARKACGDTYIPKSIDDKNAKNTQPIGRLSQYT
jgi:hypothetical protein